MTEKGQDIECLRTKTAEEIYFVTSGTVNNAWDLSLANLMITQLMEPYAPVIDGHLLKRHPFDEMRSGNIRPDTPIAMQYTSDESESFIELLFNPVEPMLNNTLVQDRDNRVPIQFFEAFTRLIFGEDADQILASKDCDCRGNCENENRCECDEYTVQLVTNMIWVSHLHAGWI